jgi:hypothetical protein
MKKIQTIVAAIAICFFMTPSIQAQNSAGIGLAYGADFEEMGLQLSGGYTLNEKMRVGADLIYYFIGDVDFGSTTLKTTALEFNGNFNYVFYNENKIEAYGIASLGLHYTSISIGGNSNSDSEIGLGVGVGAQYDLGKVKLYVEPRYFLSGFDQLNIGFGVRMGL